MCEPSLGVRQPHLVARGREVHACDKDFVHSKNFARDTGREGQRANGRVVSTRIYLVKVKVNRSRKLWGGLTLCASIGSNLMHEMDDWELAGQCTCKRQYLPASR